MGNSIQKKKKIETEKNFSAPPSPKPVQEKPKGFWLFGRPDKLKTAGPKGNEDQKRLAVHYTTSQHLQENVFIEGSRPQYLEDLHTEAQEGLKILQQEEYKNGVNFPDDESIASSDTLRPEQDISSKDGGGSPEPRSTTGNTDVTVTLSVSTRPVLSRPGSTFKPPNPVKRLDKSRKRSRRTTIMGIPNQVQKELALHRSSTFQPLVSIQLSNHDGQVTDSQSGVVIIPTVDGGTPAVNKEGARVHLSELEASRDEHLLRKHLQAMYQDEQSLNHQGFGSHPCPTSTLRPKSLAVPGMTTSSSFCPTTMFSFLQEPPGPVMSISPQATYLSTIIPNAVLPASIEVIEIDRSSSRTRGSSVNHGGSVRTVSKSSLASGDSSVSPLLSRRSDGDGSQTDHSHNDSTPMPTSASGSNWSESQSSKTIISNSSPVSSKGSTHSGNSQRVGLNGQETQQEHAGGDQDLVSLRSSVSGISNNSKGENLVTGQGSESAVSGPVTVGEDAKNKRNFIRSLSVMKTKHPPAPPRRTNSLHSNKIRSNSRVLVDSKDLNDSLSGEVATATENTAAKDEIKLDTGDPSKISTPVSNSPGYSSPDVTSSPLSPTQASSKEAGGPPEPQSGSSSSSPQKTPSEGGKFERTMSPSSGYSSQSGTPTLSPKGTSPTSPEKQKKKPVKPERSVSRASSSAASPSSSLTSLSSGASEPVNPDASTCSPSLHPQGTSPTVTANELTPNNNYSTLRVDFRELLNIPPPPKVKAPCPPPPETWVHNKRTFELLCGPCPNVSKETHKPPQIKESTAKQAGTQTTAGKEIKVLDEKQTTIDKPILELSESKEKRETFLATDPEHAQKEPEDAKGPGTETERVEASSDVQRQEQSSIPVVKGPKNQETTPKKDPPPVMKKPMTIPHREELVSTEQSAERQQKEMSSSATIEVHLAVENQTTSSQNGVVVFVDKNENEMDRSEAPSVQTLSPEVPKVNKVSPPPTPPPAYPPTPPPSRKTPPSSVSTPPDELQRVQEETHFVESCWPPPPPPLEGDSVFDGGDEVDFPPPPPPFAPDSVPDVIDSCVKQLDILNECTVAAQEVGETVKDSSDAGASVQGQNPDLPVAILQSVIYDNKPGVVAQVSKADTADEISCRPVQNVSSLSDSSPPPPLEAPPLPPITQAENPASVSALGPSSSFLRPDSLKIGDQSSSGLPVSVQPPIPVPVAPPLPAENLTHGVTFRRQPSLANRDTRSKELLSRHKSAPIPKEDANIPLVTPSLLQMVRLRSVNMTEDQLKAPTEDNPTNEGAPVQENCPVSVPGPQNIPQKPIRKSLSLKSPPQTVKPSSVTLNTPSMRLQEAIRMKTAAMSSRDGLPSRLGVRSPPYSCVSEPGALSIKSPEGYDMHKSPASTASFIFSRSTKKVVIETAASSSPEAQASLKQSLATELMKVSDQSRAAAFSNGGMKFDKVPPPVAKKPHGSISPSHHHPPCSGRMENNAEGNGPTGGAQHTRGITPPETTTTRVTADTIETLF
ncbi:uncharacterized protein KIAA1522 homolog isoform X2 [Toxotes jaculatrix]|uniref:uncharacterized protein KIAA1522 homolog isoform X2 n=1 Tax=Toxotes jaculatrix TaxID=941984 RepID=UPI001B3AF0F8|nr:uncharacterized protein KIAA1522 homolog isoform X2 [Toxotes jaculatrix]